MNSYTVTYWPPTPPTGQQYVSVSLSVTAHTFSYGEESVFFVDDAGTAVLSVPLGVYPIIQLVTS